MGGVGIAVREVPHAWRAFLDHLPDLVRNDAARHRDVGARQPLGDGHDVRLDVIGFGAEPVTRAAKAGDHLIRDHQHVILAQDLLDLRKIAFGRKDHPAGTHHRLGNKGGHGVRAFGEDHLLELLRAPFREIALTHARFRVAPIVRRLRMENHRQRQIERRMEARQASQTGRRHRDPVIATHARDDFLLLGLAANIVVIPDQFDVGVVGVRARIAEEDLAHIIGRETNDAVREANRLFRPHREEAVVVGQILNLLGDGLGDLLPPPSDVDAPEARHGVDVFLAIDVGERDALARHDDAGSGLLMRFERRVGV